MERKFLDFSLPGSECSTERKFHGSKSSLYGLFAPGNESAEERKGQITLIRVGVSVRVRVVVRALNLCDFRMNVTRFARHEAHLVKCTD